MGESWVNDVLYSVRAGTHRIKLKQETNYLLGALHIAIFQAGIRSQEIDVGISTIKLNGCGENPAWA